MPIELTKKGVDWSYLGSEILFKLKVRIKFNMLKKNHFSQYFFTKKSILMFWNINQKIIFLKGFIIFERKPLFLKYIGQCFVKFW